MAIPDRAKRLLWSRSGGYCQNPACAREVFAFFENGDIVSLGELAHVIGKSERGPRGRSSLGKSGLDGYENIILLCPTCHTLVDKSPERFSTDVLYKWKRCHENRIRRSFAVPVYGNRRRLAIEVHSLLRRNRAIFEQYGPNSRDSRNPLSDAASVWRRHVLSDVIPNNRRVADLLNTNEHLLTKRERATLDRFSLHQQAFEYNHVSGNKTAAAPLFPEEMNSILQEFSDA